MRRHIPESLKELAVGEGRREIVQIKAREEPRLRRTFRTPQGAATKRNAELRDLSKAFSVGGAP
jgi:hypothetical protein